MFKEFPDTAEDEKEEAEGVDAIDSSLLKVLVAAASDKPALHCFLSVKHDKAAVTMAL